MRYLVVVQRDVFYGDVLGPGCDGSAVELEGKPVDEDLRYGQEFVKAVPCQDTRAVAAAIRAVDAMEHCEWTVSSLKDGEWRPVAVRLKMDGRFTYDVEVC